MKKVLIITYYWPPAGGPGVQRWLKFVKYLPEFGVEPIVYIPENPFYPIVDESLLTEVPGGVEIISRPIKEPYRLAKMLSKGKTKKMSSGMISEKESSAVSKMMLYVRANYFIPDARVGWVQPSVKYLKKYLRDSHINTVITTGPPHSIHLIGLGLKKSFDITWIADFRDPWTTIHYHKSLPLSERSSKKHKLLEKDVLGNADHIVVTSPTTKKEFQELTQQDISVITNGYEPVEKDSATTDTKFTISHIGSLLEERNPTVLWEVLSELKNENTELSEDLRIQLVGKVGQEVVKSAEDNGLSQNLELPGYVNHSEAIKYQISSQILLLIEIDRTETRAIIPGKLFEYMRSGRPILAIGPKGGDVEGLLKETKSGHYFDYSQKAELKRAIQDAYQKYRSGTLESKAVNIEQFSRRNLTKKLAGLLRTI